MRKTLFAILATAVVGVSNAATLYTNGPTITHVGQGLGGLDVSMCGLDPNTAGSTVKQFDLALDYFRIADDFTMTQAFTLDQVVMQAYESQATGAASWNVREIKAGEQYARKHLLFARDGNAFALEIATGSVKQLTDFRAGPAPRDSAQTGTACEWSWDAETA